MFKSVLLALKPSASQHYVIEYSVALARKMGAELTACVVIDVEQIAPPESVPIGGGAFKRERDEELIALARVTSDKAMAACQAAATAAGVACRTEQFEGDVVEVLTRQVHEHDLLIVGHAASDETGNEALHFRILKSVPRPAIVFPKRVPTGETVLVAYDGSLRSARTLASFAYSGLGVGRTVRVVTSNADVQQSVEHCEAACRFLRRHDLVVEPHPETLEGSFAKQLMTLAADCSAGLLVMGAFGQSAVRQFFFGSTTQTVLHELPLPVFIDH